MPNFAKKKQSPKPKRFTTVRRHSPFSLYFVHGQFVYNDARLFMD